MRGMHAIVPRLVPDATMRVTSMVTVTVVFAVAGRKAVVLFGGDTHCGCVRRVAEAFGVPAGASPSCQRSTARGKVGSMLQVRPGTAPRSCSSRAAGAKSHLVPKLNEALDTDSAFADAT